MNTTLSRTALLGLLATSPVMPVAAPAQAASTGASRPIESRAGPLGAALARIGREFGVIVTVDPALVRGMQAPALHGNYTVNGALTALLAGSGLVDAPDGRGGFRVLPISRSADPNQIADSSPAPTETTLDEVVVVGALTRALVDAEQLETRQATDLSDVFRGIPSVAVGGSVGVAQKIYVRGLEDSMLNVTVDGAPQHGTLFHHIGRVTIEPELLKTVDVQTGAGEATAGFGAIGGAIRFRTRDASDLLGPDRAFGGLARGSWFSNDGYKLSGSLFGQIAGDVGFLASFVHVERNDMEDGRGDRLYGTAAEQQMAFLKVGGALSENQRFSISFEQRDEKAEFGQRPNWPVLEGERLFPSTGKRQTAVLNHGLSATPWLDLESTLYWTQSEFAQDRFDRWGLYGAAILTKGFDLRARATARNHELALGAELRADSVRSQYLAEPAVWQAWAWDPAIGRYVEKGDVIGVYAQDHWQATDRLTVSYGGRYDRYELRQVTYDDRTGSNGFSGNLGLRLQASDSLALHASFAEALRGKEIGDAFTLEKRPGRLALAPGLQPERVDNIEGGLSWAHGGWRASAVYYDMRIDDVILDQIGNGPAPQAPVYYENVGRYKTNGFELQAGFSSGPYSIDGHFNHYRSRLNGNTVEGYEHIGLGNSVGDNWTVSLGYRPTPGLRIEASLTHYDALRNIEVLQRAVQLGWIDSTQFVDKPGYTVLDLFGQWKPLGTERLTVGLALYNVLDKRYRAHASVADYNAIPDWEGIAGVREPGRNMRLSLSTAF